LRQAQVVVREDRQGTIAVEYKGKPLSYTVYHRQLHQAEETPSKWLDVALAKKPSPKRRRAQYLPPADHPWRRPISPKATT
jgi:hypothetical protein